MPTTETQETGSYTKEDVTILNLLRCEPPTLAFDFFGYGGLTRSVFRLLQDVPNLDDIVNDRGKATINIPSSLSGSTNTHTLNYGIKDGVNYILANTYNNFSQKSDAKIFARAQIRGTNGKEYFANFLALEVYREKGNGHPIWELGFYITEKGGKKVLYGEELVVDISLSETRVDLYSHLIRFVKSMKGFKYNPAWTGIVRGADELKCLGRIATEGEHTKIISHQEFNENRARWFRYLTGTLDVSHVLKFEDRCGYKTGIRVYRVELVSSHLDSGPHGHYFIDILVDTEGDPTHPNERIIKEGPYNHEDALRRFLEIGNLYLSLMYLNAGKGSKQLEIAADPSHIDFRYATIVRDRTETPITVTSWETPYGLDGRLLPPQKAHHYLQLWNKSPLPLRLDEGTHFEEGTHPRSFMGKLLNAIANIQYRNGSTFVEQAINQGAPLINPF